MAKVGSNSLNLSAGFNILGQEPIDSRLVVSSVADLLKEETWKNVGLYNGMIVGTESGEIRVLKDRDNITSDDSWVSIKGSGNENGYLEDL